MEQTLATEAEHYRREYIDLIEQVPNANFTTDPIADCFVDVNPAACQLLGHDRDRPLRLVRPRAIHGHQLSEFQAFARQVRQDGGAYTNRLSCMTGDGRVVPVPFNAVLTYDLDGRSLIRAVVSEKTGSGDQRP